MRRTLVTLFIGVFFLIPATSWSKSDSPTLEARVAQLEALVATLQSQLNAETAARSTGDANTLANAAVYTDTKILELDSLVAGLNKYVSVNTDMNLITFKGVNIKLVNGQNLTYSYNGLGNLIIGYDTGGASKSGSHNIVIGDGHTYSHSGGIVAGKNNTINQEGATVTGGRNNIASGIYSSVSGGESNTASGNLSSVSGGYVNTASWNYSSISGGASNSASGDASSVSGGQLNTASGNRSAVSGGQSNTASALVSTVSGGQNNTASGGASTVSGGQGLTVSDDFGYLP